MYYGELYFYFTEEKVLYAIIGLMAHRDSINTKFSAIPETGKTVFGLEMVFKRILDKQQVKNSGKRFD